MLIPEFLDPVCWEIAVKGCPADPKLVNHVTNEWVVFRILE
jgi:hypothetical protein